MKTNYASMFDDFVRARGLDEDDTYWPEADKTAWQVLVGQAPQDFQGGRPLQQ